MELESSGRRALPQGLACPGLAARRTPDQVRGTSTQLDKDFSDGTRLSRPGGEPPDRKKPVPPRHRFLEPIHNVKEGRTRPTHSRPEPRRSGLHTWRNRKRPARRQSRPFVCLPRQALRINFTAPYGALRPAGRPCRQCEIAPLFRLQGCGLVEPAGIEPATSSLQS